MRRLLALPVVAAVLLLAACGGGPTSGTVIGKRYVPAHSETILMPTWVGKVVVDIPEQQYHGPAWTLELRSCSQGQCDTGTVDVDEHTFDTTVIGARYDGGQ